MVALCLCLLQYMQGTTVRLLEKQMQEVVVIGQNCKVGLNW